MTKLPEKLNVLLEGGINTYTHIFSLFIGARVRTDYHLDQKWVIRTLTKLERDLEYGSGFMACADDGGDCPHCKRPLGDPIFRVDAGWFVLVEEENLEN